MVQNRKIFSDLFIINIYCTFAQHFQIEDTDPIFIYKVK